MAVGGAFGQGFANVRFVTWRAPLLVPGGMVFATIARMQSKLAAASKRSLLASHQRLTPGQRLDAYLVHCRLMFDLFDAGRSQREKSVRSRR